MGISMTDITAIRKRHVLDQWTTRDGGKEPHLDRFGRRVCQSCAQPWPCDVARLLADTPSVEPGGMAEVQSALSWALGRIDKHPLTASELLDYEAALALLPTQASDSPEKP